MILIYEFSWRNWQLNNLDTEQIYNQLSNLTRKYDELAKVVNDKVMATIEKYFFVTIFRVEKNERITSGRQLEGR